MAGYNEESCFLVDSEEAEDPRIQGNCKRIKTPVILSLLGVMLVSGAAMWKFSPGSSSPILHSSRPGPSHNGFIQYDDDTPEAKDNEPAPAPPPPVGVPGGKTFALTGATGEIASLYVSDAVKKGSGGKLYPKEPMLKATQYLQQMSLLAPGAGAEQCRAGDQNPNTTADNACYTFYSDGTILFPDRTTDVSAIPGLTLKVTIVYEKLLDNDLIAHVRGLQGVSAAQRASYCDQLRANSVFKAKALPSISNLGAMLEKAGIEKGTQAFDSAENKIQEQAAVESDPTGQAEWIDHFKKQKEVYEASEKAQAQIDKQIAQVEGERDARAQEAQAKLDAAKAEAKAAIAEAKATAATNLQDVNSKLAGLELGKADLKSGAAALAKAAAITNDGTLGKGTKLNTMQLIDLNGIFAGRIFHRGSAEADPRGEVLEFTAEAMETYAGQARQTDMLGSIKDTLTGTKKTPAPPKTGADLLYEKVVANPSESTSEYMFQSTKSSDQRSATRLYDTYGSSASKYVEQERSDSLGVGVPGILSASASSAQKSSKKTGKSKQGSSQEDNSFSKTTHEFHQVKYYMEPRAIFDIPQKIVQPTLSFLNRVRELQAHTKLKLTQKADMLFDDFGSHVCLRVTLGGFWRLTSHASSKAKESVAAMSKATSEASTKIEADSTQFGAKGGGTFMMQSVPVTIGVSAGLGRTNSKGEDNENAAGNANRKGDSSLNVQVTTDQTWYGGLSGGSPSAWRLSLGEDQNSNWRVIGKRFEDCTPIWVYFPKEHNDFATDVCVHWYTKEIQDVEDITKQSKDALLGLVEKKCTIEPESTRIGVMKEVFEAAADQAGLVEQRKVLAQSKVRAQKEEIERLKKAFEMKEVTLRLPPTVTGTDWYWGPAFANFGKQCQGLGYSYGFPTGFEGSVDHQWKGWCLRGSSFTKIDIYSDAYTTADWNYLRNPSRTECKNQHFDGGFPDGNEGVKNGRDVRGVICLKGPKDIAVQEFDLVPRVPQSGGWMAIAQQADHYCRNTKSGRDGLPNFAAGIPGRASDDGDSAKFYCLITEHDLIEEEQRTLASYEQAVNFLESKNSGCPIPTPKAKQCEFEEDEKGGKYCKLWESIKPEKDNGVDFEWSRGEKTPSRNTGPDKSRGGVQGSFFMFTEASSPNKKGDIAKLRACGVDICSTSRLTFDYSMNGDTMGSLQVWVGDNGGGKDDTKIWEASGDKGNKWYSAAVSLYGKGCIWFVGIRGEGSKSDMAIDHVAITF